MNYHREQKLKKLRQELADIESRRHQILQEITHFETNSTNTIETDVQTIKSISNTSPIKDKIRLFRSLFRGREDVYPRRFESIKTGKSGYQPSCKNEWATGFCAKPRIKCASATADTLKPVFYPEMDWALDERSKSSYFSPFGRPKKRVGLKWGLGLR